MPASTFLKGALVALVSLIGLGAQAQAQQFSLNANGTAYTTSFSAGTYLISFVDGGPFSTAYSLRDTDNDPATVTPQQSFRTLSSYAIGSGAPVEFGFAMVFDPARNNGNGGFMYAEYPTISAALGAANNVPAGFTLTSATDVTFRVVDNRYVDNSYGVTLSVTPVPEPSTYAMMLVGLALTGAVARRRSRGKA